MLNPRQIEAFRWVMRSGSITGAARQLAISQPAASRLVGDLEIRTGLALFERRGNSLSPTPEAEALLAEVERYATGLEAIGQFARELRLGRRSPLRIVALPAMAMGFLPRFVAGLIADGSLANLYLHGMPSHLIVDAVGNGQADIGLAASPPQRPGIRITPLRARAVLVVPDGHRLARRRSVGVNDLIGERMIRLAEPTYFAMQPLPLAIERQVEIVATTPLSGIACSLVAQGAGVALIDPFAASDFEGRGVVAIRFEPAQRIEVAILTAENRRLPTVAQDFIDALRRHVAKA